MKNMKCEVKVQKIMFPKGVKKVDVGEWAILSCSLNNVIEGEPILNGYGTFIVKGTVPEINLFDTYTVIGKLVKDAQFGYQYDLVYMGKPAVLDTNEKQRLFLSRILTDNQLTRLYLDLPNPFEAIANEDVDTLIKVNGIGAKTAYKLIDKYKESIDFSEVYIELDSYGLTKNLIDKLIDFYGNPEVTIMKVKENPYVLIDEIDGIGWAKADEMALNSGIEEHSDFRIEGFIKHYLKEEANQGNSWVTPQDLFEATLDNLGDIDQNRLREIMYQMYEKKILWWDEDKTVIGLKVYYELENNISNELIRLLKQENKFECSNQDLIIKTMEIEQGWKFTEEQLQAIKTVVDNQVSIITGSAGTGKSTVVSGVLSILKDYSFAQTALAGRAASRLSEITGEDGYTIHRLLDYNPMNNEFTYNKNCQLDYDIIILDEVSMVGADLFYKLIQAIANGSKLIMIGDEGQLESIGLCNVFKDMLESNVIPVARLTKIHRQAEKSAIITESIKVRNHKQITPQGYVGTEIRGELQDFEIDIYDDKILTHRRVIKHFKELYSKHKNIQDIQIIVPIKYKGDACTHELNNTVQEIVNPYSYDKNEVNIKIKKDNKVIEYILRENDKIIVNRNNKKTKTTEGETCRIYNGNLGTIKEIDGSIFIINFELWGDIIIPRKFWNTIELGYAMTGHKIQGSESKYIIIGLDYTSYSLLTKEWLYTAMTRAQEYSVLCAENKALRYAISNSNVSSKQTFLSKLLVDNR